ncbi:MAG: HlyD family efflux transporter periplasmic adaptor subunit [Planctomycetaceae bacterium]|nr:HlyD family efflux transporter periplasmic adaptor subunit [Planctomycetaceae bacterium]
MSTSTVPAHQLPPVTGAGLQPEARTDGRRRGWIGRVVPNVVVFSLLAGVLFMGHSTGWKMPRASQLFGAKPQVADDWCAEHLVPESVCIECNEDLLPKTKEFGFCRIHGVTECVICHPELAQVVGEPDRPAYDTAKAIAVRDRPENNSRNTLHKRRVQFTSAESAAKAGIDIDVVGERPMSDIIRANGELRFAPTRVAHLSSRVGGTIAAVFKSVGDDVQAGDVLALVDAAAVGQAKSLLLQSIVQVQLKRATVDRLNIAAASVPGKFLVEAEAALEEAEIGFLSARQSLINLGFELPDDLENREAKAIADELRLLGIPAVGLLALTTQSRTANLIPVLANYAGVVVSSDVVAGEVVDSTKLLFTIADPRQLWLTLNVRQEDARYVSRGQTVRFRTDDGSDEITGPIVWVSPAVDERTRTLQVRVLIDNADGTLRDRTFGTGWIILREELRAIVVPREAVQSTSDARFVFVRNKNWLKEDGPKLFHVRQVRIGAADDRYVELLAGVLPGEVVATKGSPVLLGQLLRSNLGAGCGCHDR